MAKFFHRAFVLIAMTLAATAFAAAETPKIKLGFAKCAHCLPMSLTPGLAKGVEIEATGFNSGNDVLTALVSKSIDVAQVTYLHYVTALDKGFDVVAVSGQINGGSECISSNKLALPGEDWAGFKALVAKAKAGGQPLKVAASRASVIVSSFSICSSRQTWRWRGDGRILAVTGSQRSSFLPEVPTMREAGSTWS